MKYFPAFAVLLSLGLAACDAVSPPPPPPPIKVEVIPNPPVTETLLIWQPGHWDWTGSGYVWVPGAFTPRGTHSNLWMQGFWDNSGGSWKWVPAHWVQ
jgi:hypothetical protein